MYYVLKRMARIYIYGHGTYWQEKTVGYKTTGCPIQVPPHKMVAWESWASASCLQLSAWPCSTSGRLFGHYEIPRKCCVLDKTYKPRQLPPIHSAITLDVKKSYALQGNYEIYSVWISLCGSNRSEIHSLNVLSTSSNVSFQLWTWQ
jgi:hypothetical protein